MQQLIGMTLNDIKGTVQGNHVMVWSKTWTGLDPRKHGLVYKNWTLGPTQNLSIKG